MEFHCIIYHSYRNTIPAIIFQTIYIQLQTTLKLHLNNRREKKREKACIALDTLVNVSTRTTISQTISILEEIRLARNRPEAHPSLLPPLLKKKK